MNVKEIKSKKLYKEYSLEIPFEVIDKEINSKIQNMIPSITIPGFRKGKAPLNIVKKKYEETVINEVIQKVVNLNTSNLIKEKKLSLFRPPKIDLKNYEKNKPVVIEIKMDLEPDIKLKDFKSIKLNKYEINLSKKAIDNQFKKFIDSQKSFEKIDINREIIKTDRVTIDFETINSDIPEYLKSQKNLPIDTGLDEEIIPGINNELISRKLKKGDKIKVNSDLSKLLKNENLNKVEYSIKIISIEKKVKFEITKDYLKSNGFKNEDDLKKLLEKNLIQQYNQGVSQIEKKQLMDQLNKTYDFDLPEGVLQDDFQEIWQKLEHAKKNNSIDEDDKQLSEDKLKKRYKKISERRVKLGVLLQFIAKKEKITISEDELSKGIMQYSSQYPGQEKQIMDYLKNNPSSVESIRGPLLEEKIIKRISSKSTIINKKINEEQYKKLEEETFDIKKDKL